MTRKTNTIKVSGGSDYAKVAERTKLFWEDNPHGKINSEYVFTEDGQIIFTSTVIKDGTKPEIGSANGSAMGKIKADKDFEKYETISLGRALAKLGYLASGDIASFEEMEDFIKFKEVGRAEYIEEQVELFEKAKTLDELKDLWMKTDKSSPAIMEAKDKRKEELNANS